MSIRRELPCGAIFRIKGNKSCKTLSTVSGAQKNPNKLLITVIIIISDFVIH